MNHNGNTKHKGPGKEKDLGLFPDVRVHKSERLFFRNGRSFQRTYHFSKYFLI